MAIGPSGRHRSGIQGRGAVGMILITAPGPQLRSQSLSMILPVAGTSRIGSVGWRP